MDVAKSVSSLFTSADLPTSNTLFHIQTTGSTLILLTASTLVTSVQYLGNPIECDVDAIPSEVMDTYCWIQSTFTLADNLGEQSQPGVGPSFEGDRVTRHKYYQWVCFVLIFQAALCMLPRLLWHHWESGSVASLVSSPLLLVHSDARLYRSPRPLAFVKSGDVKTALEAMSRRFESSHRNFHAVYMTRHITCELLNLAVIVLHMLLMDVFLGGTFSTYGLASIWHMSQSDPEERNDPMNLVFPKVAKCTFNKFGPTGTVQTHDGLCVLAINIINEKIYVFLWCWFLVLLAISTLYLLVYRLPSLLSTAFRRKVLGFWANGSVDDQLLQLLADKLTAGECFFIGQLKRTLDPMLFADLLKAVYLERGGRRDAV